MKGMLFHVPLLMYICIFCGLYRSCVRVVTSDRPGMGKSFYIQEMAKTLRKQGRKTSYNYTIPIHGPEVTPDTVMEFLSEYLQHPPCSMYHLDISSDVSFLVYY